MGVVLLIFQPSLPSEVASVELFCARYRERFVLAPVWVHAVAMSLVALAPMVAVVQNEYGVVNRTRCCASRTVDCVAVGSISHRSFVPFGAS